MKNKLSYVIVFLLLIIDALSDHITLFLNIDVKYFLATVLFISITITIYKALQEKKMIDTKLINKIRKQRKKRGLE
jgi:hypothetical protein|nr:MAG TPA: TMEM156 protein family protein [Caudoviricetes sp.]